MRLGYEDAAALGDEMSDEGRVRPAELPGAPALGGVVWPKPSRVRREEVRGGQVALQAGGDVGVTEEGIGGMCKEAGGVGGMTAAARGDGDRVAIVPDASCPVG